MVFAVCQSRRDVRSRSGENEMRTHLWIKSSRCERVQHELCSFDVIFRSVARLGNLVFIHSDQIKLENSLLLLVARLSDLTRFALKLLFENGAESIG